MLPDMPRLALHNQDTAWLQEKRGLLLRVGKLHHAGGTERQGKDDVTKAWATINVGRYPLPWFILVDDKLVGYMLDEARALELYDEGQRPVGQWSEELGGINGTTFVIVAVAIVLDTTAKVSQPGLLIDDRDKMIVLFLCDSFRDQLQSCDGNADLFHRTFFPF